MSLKRYREKRDFRRTPEPAGKKKTSAGSAFFVIQKHAARRLHYDFRMEMNGVLVSWAVPKGPPLVRGEKRLAVHVEDHPLAYADFEGVIPKGNYGAGSVMVWDFGRYRSLTPDPVAAVKKGKLDFFLEGKKLKGDWTLVRLRGRAESGKEPWLLIKRAKDARPISTRRDDRSALTGRSMKRIAAAQDRVWESSREARNHKRSKTAIAGLPSKLFLDDLLQDLPSKKAAFIPPMMARLAERLPPRIDWKLEIKYDGIRAIAVKNKKTVRLFSRNRLDLKRRFPLLAEAVSALACETAVLDGEVVALDDRGRSSFQLLQDSANSNPPIFYYLFDLLQAEGRDLEKLPLEKRREILKKLLEKASDPLRFSSNISGSVKILLRRAKQLGLEGFIAKKAGSGYEPGRRSGTWLKIKALHQQEFVIGGFTPPQGSRLYFGALLVGYYQGNQLLFASKVGTGFNVKTLASLFGKMKKSVVAKCPFVNLPQPGSLGISLREMRECRWVKPKWMAELRFSEWTRDGHLRHPVFLGLREDKNPKEVIRESPSLHH